MIEDPRRPGKYKKVKKQIPDYIPEHDALILASVRKLAYHLDMSLFDFMGIRFGWEAVIGFVPGAGDVIAAALAYYLVQKASKVEGGLPSSVRIRMMINILIEFCGGLVPIIGDVAIAAFKCNTKNLRLLEVHLDQKYKPNRRDERDLAGVDREKRRRNCQSGMYHINDPPPATVFEDFSDEEEDRRQFMRNQGASDRVRQPRETYAPNDSRVGRGGRWFGGAKGAKGAKGGSRRDNVAQAPMRQETGTTRR